MKTANIAELKNHLSVYPNEVKRGGEVRVRDCNAPFAKIVPLRATDDFEAEEHELIARGLLTAAWRYFRKKIHHSDHGGHCGIPLCSL